MTDQQIAAEQVAENNKTINIMMRQLGGRRFLTMTGTKPVWKSVSKCNPSIGLKLIRNASKANWLIIEYMRGNDWYKMTFNRVHGEKITTKAEFNMIYDDQLEQIFTRTTGLYTRL